MGKPLHRLAVLTHFVAGNAMGALQELAQVREQLGLELLVPEEEVAKHPQLSELGYRLVGEPELRTADACLVFGGDGTVLRALGRLLGTGVPTVGVNFGNVGFLASLPQEGWRQGLADVVRGRYVVADLLTVEARLGTDHYTAVNDVVLSRTQPRGVMHLQYSISGASLGTMRCDGMIIATPTGSTAYNLSCGGPLAAWDANVLLVNFVAPHSLGFRPLVLRPDHQITVQSFADCGEIEIIIDGRVVGLLDCNTVLRVSSSPLRAHLMVREGISFYRNVEEKLFGFGPDAHGADVHGTDVRDASAQCAGTRDTDARSAGGHGTDAH
jgi:NAD+ kinase